MTKNILIIGAGKLGLPLANCLYKQHRLSTLSKSDKSVPAGVEHICADVFALNKAIIPQDIDWVYVILTPSERSVAGYQAIYVDSIRPILSALNTDRLQRLVYVSSTQVFGQNGGETVDDDTPPCPSSDYGKVLYAGELLWQAYLKDKLTIIRPSGLIDGDSRFLSTQAKNLTAIDEEHYINLICRQDVIAILASLPAYAHHLAQHNQSLQPSYILTHSPMVRHDLLNAIRQQCHLPPIKSNEQLPITGKKLIANRLQALLTAQQIKLSPIYSAISQPNNKK